MTGEIFRFAEIIRSFKEKEKMKEDLFLDPEKDRFVYQTPESFDGTG